MTDNEKLIEEARALQPTWHRGMYGSRDDMYANVKPLVSRLADALEAAEKAHTPTGHAKESDTSTERVNNGADSSHVTPTDDERAHALHDAFWAVHVGRFYGRDAEHGVDTFYAGTNAAKRAIESLHGAPIIRPWHTEGRRPQGEPSSEVPSWDTRVQKLREAVAAQTGSYLSIEGAEAILETVSPEPQGEPSDAQADEAQRGYHAFAFGPEEVDVFLTPERLAKGRDAWKAALRAAGVGGVR